ncbi:hypothetical protein [Novacetimonas sp. GS1]|uniref:hypothetical protein n=1 Tax=Novacetimonas sp. GS1 TaxID=3119990 RepID=UPI002FCCE348
MSSNSENASSSSKNLGKDDASNTDEQDDIPGYSTDSGDTHDDSARPVAPTDDAGRPISDLERAELLKENEDIRGTRRVFFLMFGIIAFGSFLAIPFEVYSYINNGLEKISQRNTTASLYAIISVNVIFAVVGAVPLTIFITLAQLFKKKSNDKNDEKTSSINVKKPENISDSIKSLISTLSFIVKNVKDAWKDGMK